MGIVEKVLCDEVKPLDEAKVDSSKEVRDSNSRAGGIKKEWQIEIEQRNKFSVGESIEIMKPNGENIEAQVLKIVNEEKREQESAPHPQQRLVVTLDKGASQYDILRKKSLD